MEGRAEQESFLGEYESTGSEVRPQYTVLDEEVLRQALAILKPDGEVFEIRVLGDGKGRTQSGYFTSASLAISELKKLERKGELQDTNIYYTLNVVDEACYSRKQRDRFHKYPDATTSDNDILSYKWVLVDVDPKRSSKISSSEKELEDAKRVANNVYKFLRKHGFETPITAMSGNGCHLLYRVDFLNTRENSEIVHNFLKALDILFSGEKTGEAQIDTSVFNASRISKLYGTLAQKGSNNNARPFRMSRLRSVPDEIKTTPIEYFTNIAAEILPKQPKPEAYNRYNPAGFDIETWMQNHGLKYKKKDGGSSGFTRYILDRCPFDENHKAPDSMICTASNGAIGFKCLHNSCQDKKWADVRQLLDPTKNEQASREWQNRQAWSRYDIPNSAKEQFEVHTAVPPKPKEVPPEERPPHYGFLTAEQILDLPVETEDFILTGTTQIDMKMRGLKKGYVSLVSGLRGGSKSTWLSSVVLNAIQSGHKVIVYSGELTSKNFLRWMNLQAAGKNHVKPTRWADYYVVDEATQRAIAKWMSNNLLLYHNDFGHNYKQMREMLEAAIEEQKTDLLVFDNLMMLDIDDFNQRDKYDAQKQFIRDLSALAKRKCIHIMLVAHPRKSTQFLRLQDVSGTNDLVNMCDNAFIIHRNNEDFRTNVKTYFKWRDDDPIFQATNVIEIAKDRDIGTQDVFIPLWYEKESKRLKNSPTEMISYGWEQEVKYNFVETYEEQEMFDSKGETFDAYAEAERIQAEYEQSESDGVQGADSEAVQDSGQVSQSTNN